MINIMNALRARGIGVGSRLEGDAATTDVRQNKTFMNEDGGPFTGGIPTRDAGGAVTVTPGANPTTLQPGIYDNSIVVAGDADLVSANVKAGANIFNVAGKAQVVDTTEATYPAAAGDIKAPKVTFVNGVKVTGNQADNGPAAAETVNLTAQNQTYTIAAGFHSGLRTIKAVITNLAAGVIKAGTTVGGILGTFTADATAGAAQLLYNYTAYVNGAKVTGSMPSNGDQSATLSISDANKPTKAIPAGYTPGGTITAQLAAALASLIKTGSTIGGVAGTYTAKRFATGAQSIGAGSGYATLTVTGLAFTPMYIIAVCNGGTTNGYDWSRFSVYADSSLAGATNMRPTALDLGAVVDSGYLVGDASPVISANGFSIKVAKDGSYAEVAWLAFE